MVYWDYGPCRLKIAKEVTRNEINNQGEGVGRGGIIRCGQSLDFTLRATPLSPLVLEGWPLRKRT